MAKAPEPCLGASFCRSPTACEGWGYCRERNFMHGEIPDEKTRERWRILAKERQNEPRPLPPERRLQQIRLR